MYKMMLLTLPLSLLFFTSCGQDRTSTESEKVQIFHPLITAHIPYIGEKKDYFSDDILIRQLRDSHDYNKTIFQVERVNSDEDTNLTSFSLIVDYSMFYATFNHNMFLVHYDIVNRINNKWDVQHKLIPYKLENNNTVSKLQALPINIEKDGYNEEGYSRNITLQDDTLAVHIKADYCSENNDSEIKKDKVLIYKRENNDSFTYMQTLQSDDNDTRVGNFGRHIFIGKNTLIVNDNCKLNLFTKTDDNATFSKQDTYFFEGHHVCRIYANIKGDYFFAYMRAERFQESTLFTLKKNKFTPLKTFKEYGAMFTENTFYTIDKNVSIFKLNDKNNSTEITKFLDINLTTSIYHLFNGGDQSLLLVGDHKKIPSFTLLDNYPEDKIYILSDKNTSLYLDEEMITPVYTIEANSLNKPLTYTLEGEDESFFHILNNAIIPKQVLNYENPLDTNQDNIYEVTLVIDDAKGNHKTLPLHISIVNHQYIQRNTQTENDINGTNLSLGRSLYASQNDVMVSDRTNAYLFQNQNNHLKKMLKFTNESNQTNNGFANTMAKSDNAILIAAPNEDINTSKEGVVYTYLYNPKTNTIVKKSKIHAPQIEQSAYFGCSMGMDHNISIIGAPGISSSIYHYTENGKAFVYHNESNGTLTFLQTLQSPTATPEDSFGSAIYFDYPYLIIGAKYADNYNGEAYLYKANTNNTFNYITTLHPDKTKETKKQFGSIVALSQNYMIVGNNYFDGFYVYSINPLDDSIEQLALLKTPNDTVRFNGLTIDQQEIFIAAYNNSKESIFHYHIEDNKSVILKETLSSDMEAFVSKYDNFSISAGDGLFILGAPNANYNGKSSGAITLYTKDKD